MKVPLEWLKEYVTIKLTAGQLAERLTMAGLEVTGITLINYREEVLDLEITPNRADCLSIIGMAREAAAILGEPLKFSKLAPGSSIGPRATTSAQHAPMRITIDDRKGCQRYIGRLIQDVRVGPSPDWMQRRLAACGLRPINNIVDVTNYVLLEYGQPLHAFDADRLAEQSIVVRRAKSKEPITTLDGVTRALTPEMLVISDGRSAVAVAGVMGGAGSEVTPQTRTVLLESALFDPLAVRRTARELGLVTESSYRFERGVDPVGVETASARAAALITKVAGGTERAVRDVGAKPAHRTVIALETSQLNRWLGTSVPSATVRTTLAKLGCRVASGAGDAMQVSAPSFRRDLLQSVDLTEEVARVMGYERIPSALPVVPMASLGPPEGSTYQRLQSLRRGCASLGLTEAVTWSLVSAQDLSRCGLDEASAVRLANPLSQDHAYLRPSLLMGLLQAVRRNLSQGTSRVYLFELGAVTQPGTYPVESWRLGMVIAGLWVRDWQGTQPCDFFRLKGVVESLLRSMSAATAQTVSASRPWAEPGQCADVVLGGARVGVVGQVARAVAHALDIEEDVWFAELDVDPMLSRQRAMMERRVPTPFPPVKRDLSLIVADDAPFDSIAQTIREAGTSARAGTPSPPRPVGGAPGSVAGGIEIDVKLIDRYAGKQVPEGKHSLTFSIEYRDPSRTLTAAEVDELHRRIGSTLVSRFHAQLR